MPCLGVVVIDDHEIVRAGLRALLAQEADINVLGVAPSGEEGLELIDKLRPDVAVVDYSLPGMTGVEVCEAISRAHPKMAVIMLTTFLDDQVIKRSLDAGARAFVYKDVDARDLKKALRAVARGEAILDPKVTGRVMRWMRHKGRSTFGQDGLSRRETDVLRLVARGGTNAEIGRSLGITENTVKTYLRRIMEKLECHSRAEAAARASKLGLL